MEKKELVGIAGALLLIVCAIFCNSVSAITVDDYEIVDIAVTISSQFTLDVKPYDITFSATAPGGTASTFTDDISGVSGQSKLQIRNIGSTNITSIWVNASSPGTSMTDSPFGSGAADNYDPANMFAMTKIDPNATHSPASTDYFFPNRREYAQAVFDEDGNLQEGQVIPFLNASAVAAYDNMSYGRFHFGDQEWFWSVVQTSAPAGGDCSTASTDFIITKEAHNATDIGDVDIYKAAAGSSACQNADNCQIFDLSADGEVKLTGGNTPSEINGYNIVVSDDCQYVDFIYWNAPEVNIIANYFLDGDGTDDITAYGGKNWDRLTPGEELSTHVLLKIPLGTVSGSISGGASGAKVTFLASTS